MVTGWLHEQTSHCVTRPYYTTVTDNYARHL